MAENPDLTGNELKEKVHYSDEELKEFKELILTKLEATKLDLAYYQDQVKQLVENPNSKSVGSEDGVGTNEKEYLNQMASRQLQFIKHLENALIRIENKTYGICRVTGKLIPKDRLRAVPHATLSIEAKERQHITQ
ncbi:MAG TPA: TraR/DksA C4-type zinc finger protein [Chitinophagales bacterium]|nr:TraR/DksA C4-type zinc finger protein [Chitinophagales bacterium]HRK25862.1 TraR/DksA C4-type zinc finger protein [Chitinophagales bacterium]